VPVSGAYIFDAVRTPRGRVARGGGTLADVGSHELVGGLLRALVERGLTPEVVDDLVLGVSTVAWEQAGDVGRIALASAGWPEGISAGTVSRMCTSGLDAISGAAAQVSSGMLGVVLAGGVESMSRVPMFSDKPAFALDPGLGDLGGFVTIGVAADATALRHGLSRGQLDEWTVRSHERAASAPSWESIVPVIRDGDVLLAADEGARPGITTEDLARLPALFTEDPTWERVVRRLPDVARPETGLHTVASAPQLCDAASLVVIGGSGAAERLGREPVGRVVSWAHAAVRAPLLDATVPAATRALDLAGVTVADIAVVEVNESFAMTPLVFLKELGDRGLDASRVNLHGGAVAVGHPLGATGGILLANALEILRRRGGGYGLLVIPAALGVAMAVVIEAIA